MLTIFELKHVFLNSRNSDYIDIKVGPVAKLVKRNTAATKETGRWRHSNNCNVIAIYGKFAAIRKLDSGCMVYKTYIFIKSNLLSYRTWKQN